MNCFLSPVHASLSISNPSAVAISAKEYIPRYSLTRLNLISIFSFCVVFIISSIIGVSFFRSRGGIDSPVNVIFRLPLICSRNFRSDVNQFHCRYGSFIVGYSNSGCEIPTFFMPPFQCYFF